MALCGQPSKFLPVPRSAIKANFKGVEYFARSKHASPNARLGLTALKDRGLRVLFIKFVCNISVHLCPDKFLFFFPACFEDAFPSEKVCKWRGIDADIEYLMAKYQSENLSVGLYDDYTSHKNSFPAINLPLVL